MSTSPSLHGVCAGDHAAPSIFSRQVPAAKAVMVVGINVGPSEHRRKRENR
jgi:hypothetical protein